MAGLKDRLTCPNCNKEIVNKDRVLISNCPYCGTWLPLVRWSTREDVEELGGLAQAHEFIQKGITFQEKGQLEQAIKLYDQAAAINDSDIAIWNNKGSCLSQLGKYEEAIHCFDKTLSKEDNVDARLMKGLSLAFLKRYDEAWECYNQAYAIDPANQKATMLKTYLDMNAGALKSGKKAKAPADQGKSATVEGYVQNMKKGLELYDQGLAFSKQFNMTEAIKCYDEALTYVPGDEGLWFEKGKASFFLGKNEQAIACYDKAIAARPTDGAPWYTKGLILELLHKDEEAQDCFKMAASLGERDAKKHIVKPKFSLFKRK